MIRFIHIKKNGGTSVYKYLRSQGLDFFVGEGFDLYKVTNQHLYANHFKDEDSWKFCVVRNPYSRLVSFYTWCQRLPKWQNIKFSDFVNEKMNKGRAKGAWNLQLDYMVNDGESYIDKVFRFESMTKSIPDFFGFKEPMPHLNQTTTKNWQSYYTKTLATKVYDHFEQDFISLKYDPCLNSF